MQLQSLTIFRRHRRVRFCLVWELVAYRNRDCLVRSLAAQCVEPDPTRFGNSRENGRGIRANSSSSLSMHRRFERQTSTVPDLRSVPVGLFQEKHMSFAEVRPPDAADGCAGLWQLRGFVLESGCCRRGRASAASGCGAFPRQSTSRSRIPDPFRGFRCSYRRFTAVGLQDIYSQLFGKDGRGDGANTDDLVPRRPARSNRCRVLCSALVPRRGCE